MDATLSAAELAAMRADAETSLAGTAIIQDKSYVSDGGGGGTTTWTASGTVACRKVAASSVREAEPVTGGAITPDAQWIFTLPAATAISTESRILHSGGTFEVAQVPDRTWEITKRVTANEVL